MSHIYANWEKLVVAVIKKQQLWELFHSNSIDSSFSSDFSDTSSGGRVSDCVIDSNNSIRRFKQPILEINFNEVLESGNVAQEEWELYEPGVYMTLSTRGIGSVNVKRVQFSGIRFDAVQAKTWWLENQEKVYETYDFRCSRRMSIEQEEEAETEARRSVKKWKFYNFFSQSQTTGISPLTISSSTKATSDGTNEVNKPFNKTSKKVRIKEPILEINFNKILESANIDDECWSYGYGPDNCEKRIKRYEAGVYLTLSTLEDGTVNVELVRFSRNIFDAEQVKTWWIENQSDVYGRYNARDL